jgi:hypothetical protein
MRKPWDPTFSILTLIFEGGIQQGSHAMPVRVTQIGAPMEAANKKHLK